MNGAPDRGVEEAEAEAAAQDRGDPAHAATPLGRGTEVFADESRPKDTQQEVTRGIEMYTEFPLHSLDLKGQEDIFTSMQSGKQASCRHGDIE